MRTLERCLVPLAAATILIAPLHAQSAERRATFTGGGGDTGKCTIEVSVDGAADVEIRGDHAVLRTLTGQPAQWRRFVCSGPMPANPSDFHFVGVDGRGGQDLIQDPRSSRGVAIVRIQDPDGGAEGYTFDLVWQGAGVRPGPAAQPPGQRNYGASTVESSPGRRQEASAADRFVREDRATSACQAAAARQIRRSGYGDAEFNWDADARQTNRIAGSATAQRGNNGRAYDFSVRCSVNPSNGRVVSVQLTPR